MREVIEAIKNNPTLVATVLRILVVTSFAGHVIDQGEIDVLVASCQAIIFVAIDVWNRSQVTPVRKIDHPEDIPPDTSGERVHVREDDTAELPMLTEDLRSRTQEDTETLVPPWINRIEMRQGKDVSVEDTILILRRPEGRSMS